MKELLLKKPGQKLIMLGNAAIVRGALESGVQAVFTYPGTPASEIGDIFYKIKNQKSKIKNNFYFEYSTNEKVALEGAVGASFSGLKTLVAMKHFGLNVGLDSLIPFGYTGTKGPTLIVVADDVGCWSSAQSEQNSRFLSYLAHIPTLEPSDPQDCKDFVQLGFEISRRFEIPVMIRITTRVAHQRGIVKLGQIKVQRFKIKGKFLKDFKKFVTLPPRVLEQKSQLFKKIEKIKEFSEKSPVNKIYPARNKALGIITSGISYWHVKEALQELNLNLPVLKLGFFYPLPEKKIKNFIQKLKKILVVEELEGLLEKEVQRLSKDCNLNLKIFGKDLIPEIGELRPEIVTLAVAKFANQRYSPPQLKKIFIPPRSPQLCAGTPRGSCPYWLVISAIKKAVNPNQVIFGGDIGCYMLFGTPAVALQDYLSCMGSSVGIAHGIKKSTNQKLITFIGDSTFFHAGIPALINTVFNKSNPLIIILDNQTTAMTGHQPHPGAPAKNKAIKIEDIVRACQVKNLKIIDPQNLNQMVKTIKDYLNKKEVSVIIARRPCLFVKR